MPEFYMILAQKIIKIPEFLLYLPEFYMVFGRKVSKFYIIIARKKISCIFLGGRWGHVLLPPSPTPM